jgi:tetratricopeptide (TPR) repeat protein
MQCQERAEPILVSLCMIVRDEAKHLPGCLESVRGLADEVVVVDTGSRDSTRDIARAYGARVFEMAWCDDFSAARNEWFRHARGRWIFWMDADDRLPAASRAELEYLLRTLPSENVAYTMRVTCPAPDGEPMFEVQHVRLFRNEPGLRWEYAAHEQIAPSVRRTGASLQTTDIEILHIGYTSASVRAKTERNLRLLDLGLERNPMDSYLLMCRGEALVSLGRGAEALVALNLHEVSLCGRSSPRHAMVLKARAHALEGDLVQALEAVSGTLRYVDAGVTLLRAELLACLGHYAESEVYLRAQPLVDEDVTFGGCSDRTADVYRHHLLAELLLRLGRVEEAELEARIVTRRRPSFGFAWITLGEALLAKGEDQAFYQLLAELGTSEESDIGRTVLLSARCLRRGAPSEASIIVARALTESPGHVALLKARVRALFGLGVRGSQMCEAVAAALGANPICIPTWEIRRACHGSCSHVKTPKDSD